MFLPQINVIVLVVCEKKELDPYKTPTKSYPKKRYSFKTGILNLVNNADQMSLIGKYIIY